MREFETSDNDDFDINHRREGHFESFSLPLKRIHLLRILNSLRASHSKKLYFKLKGWIKKIDSSYGEKTDFNRKLPRREVEEENE